MTMTEARAIEILNRPQNHRPKEIGEAKVFLARTIKTSNAPPDRIEFFNRLLNRKQTPKPPEHRFRLRRK